MVFVKEEKKDINTCVKICMQGLQTRNLKRIPVERLNNMCYITHTLKVVERVTF